MVERILRPRPESIRAEATRRGVTQYQVRKGRAAARGITPAEAVGHAGRVGRPGLSSREMRVVTGAQVTTFATTHWSQRSTIGRYWNEVERAVAGKPNALGRSRGWRVGGIELETDVDALAELGRQGRLAFKSIYAAAGR